MALLPIIVFVFFAVIIKFLLIRPKHFPPGPRGLPLIGNLNLFTANDQVNKLLQNLALRFGSVTGLYLGPIQPFIVISGLDAIKETLHNDDLNSRPSGNILNTRSFGEKLGLIFTDGAFWQEQRRFTLRHLRDLGFGKTSIESQMMDEINELINDIKESAQSEPNGAFEFKSTFGVPVINILWAIIGGKRFTKEEATFKQLVVDIEEVNKSGNIGLILFPVPKFVIDRFPAIATMMGLDVDLIGRVQKLIKDTIDEHLASRSQGNALRDFLDVYLEEMDKKSCRNEPTTFGYKQLVTSVLDLFGAGSDTSSNTIGFAVLYLVVYPDVQRRIQTELDDVCGDALPSLAHRSQLPYTEAFIMEVMRMGNVVPVGVPHCAAKDTTIQGFHIPKGSLVVINNESLFQDKTIWKDPENFRPERHLDVNGKVIKNEALIPFGIGKRACLGEPLARNTVFLFVTALAKTFEFKTVPGEALPSLEPNVGITLGPRPFRAKVMSRR